MFEELKLAIKVDDDAIEQSLLKQFANAEKMANKVVLTFNNIDLDDKAVEAKFKEMQKMAGKNPIDLSIDKSSIEMLSAISKQLGNIFDIAKGKSIIDSSATVADVNKITQSTNQQVKAVEKVTSSYKNQAYELASILKMLAKLDTYGDAPYAENLSKVIKSSASTFKEGNSIQFAALKNGFTEEMLKYLRGFSVNLSGAFNYSETLGLDNATISNVEVLINYFRELLKEKLEFNNIKLNTSDIEELIKALGILKKEHFDDGTKSGRNIYGDGSLDKYSDLPTIIQYLKQQEKQAVATAQAEQKLVDVEKDIGSSSVSESQNKIQEELKETQKQAEQTSEALSNITDGNKSNISSENSIVENQNQLKENKKLTDENISSLYEFIKLCQEQARVLGETNEELKERAAYFKDENISGKVSVGTHYAGNHDASILDGANSDIHSHFSKYASFSESDLFNLKEQLKNFMVMGTDELTHLDLSGINEEILRSITLRYDTVVKELNQQFLNNLSIKDNLKFTDIEDIPESIFEKAFEYAEQSSNIDYDYDKYDEFFESEIKRIREKLLQGASLNDIVNVASEDISKFEVDGVSDDIKQFREKFVDGIRGYLSNILQENDVFNPDKLLNLKEYNDGRNNALRSVLDDLGVGADRLKTIDISNLEEGYTSVLNVLGLVNDKQEEVIQTAKQVKTNSPIKDVFQGDDKVNTDASTTAIKEESQALEQVSTSAKEAATSKEKFANANKEVKASADETAISVDKEISALEKVGNRFESQAAGLAIKPDDQHQFSSWKKQLEDLNIEIAEYKSKVENLSKIDIADEAQINKAKTEIEKLGKSIKETINAMTKTPQAKRGWTDIGASKAAEKVANVLKQNTKMSKEARDAIRAYYNELRSGNPSQPIDEILVKVNRLVQKERELGRVGKSFGEIFKEKVIYGGAAQLAGMVGFYDVINVGREIVTNIKEVDTALTELRKVSDATEQRLTTNFKNSADTAKELGATISDVISATADWSRMGFDIDESEELARVSTLYKNVGDGIDIETANNSLISTLQGFQLDASEAESIIDKFNEVANNYAIDSTGIGEALQRSAASFNAANTDLSKSIALITATNEVVQNPDSVGTLWKTMSARIRGAETELEELGEETDEYTKTTSKLRDLVQSLTGFDIMIDEDTFKDVYEIILGIGKEWDNLTDVEQASLGEALAGKRNANALYAVLGNLDTLQSAYETAEESAGKQNYLNI